MSDADRAPSFGMQTIASASRSQLVCSGEIDLSTAPRLEAETGRLCAAGASEIVLDLRKVSFMDSSGLKATLASQRLCQEQGRGFSVIPGQAQVQRLFEITAMYDLFRWRTTGQPRSHAYRDGQRSRLRI